MEQPDSDNPAAASMKMMTYFMPLMSAFLAISLPSGLGVYWIATAVIQTSRLSLLTDITIRLEQIRL